MKQYYVLFRNHSEGLELRRQLTLRSIASTIVPTPRALSHCCGISLQVRQEDVETIRMCVEECEIPILDIASVEKDIDVRRDRFC